MSYFAPIAIMTLVLSPVLLPLAITAAHTVTNWRRRNAESTSARHHRAPASA